MADALIAVSATIGAALLALQLKKEPEGKSAGQATAPPSNPAAPAPVVVPVFMPQARPGAADSGGPSVIYALPPDITPQDVADYYASQGRPHDAGWVINLYQGGSSTPPPGHDVPSPIPPASEPLPPVAPLDPWQPPAPEPEPTHQDVLGRTQPGPPSNAESSTKAAFGYVGGMLLTEAGTAKVAVDLATKGRAGLGGPVTVGLGIGLEATQVLQDVGFFDHVVKPAGDSFSKKVGEPASKAVATALVVPATLGAVVKAAVTPGESVVGNVKTAVSKTALPDAARTVRVAAGDTGQKVLQGAQAGKAVLGDLGHRFNQGAATIGGLFQQRWR